MPVVVESRTIYKSSVTPENLDEETDVVNIAAQSEIYLIEGYIDLVNLASGDTLIVKEYLSADEVNVRKYKTDSYSGAQGDPIVRFHTKTTKGGYKVTIEQTSGTLRAVPFWFVREQMVVT